MTLAERSTHWLIISKPKNSSPIGRDTKHDEQADARKRRSRAQLKWKVFRRRPVIADAKQQLHEMRYRILGSTFRPA